MEHAELSRTDGWCRTMDSVISRRAAMRASGVAALALLSGSALGAEETKKADAGKSGDEARKQAQERMEQSKAFFERLRNASPEERAKIMAEDRAQRQRQAIDDLKQQLGISDTEWAAVRPRIEAVYNLVHPPQQFGPGISQPRTEVQQKSDELRELLRDEKAAAERVKDKLTAFRAAKEKANRELATARQSLRKVMTVRQEAQLVLNGLLD
jgi:chromosome segregation ATPase